MEENKESNQENPITQEVNNEEKVFYLPSE